jgi:hypothetical protein
MLASLNQEISFVGINNQKIVLPEDTIVWVDYTEGIAYYDNQAFDVFHFEYSVLN